MSVRSSALAVATGLPAACVEVPADCEARGMELPPECFGALTVDVDGPVPVFYVGPGDVAPTRIDVSRLDACNDPPTTGGLLSHSTPAWGARELGAALEETGVVYGVAPAGATVTAGPMELVAGETYAVGIGGRAVPSPGVWQAWLLHGSGAVEPTSTACPSWW